MSHLTLFLLGSPRLARDPLPVELTRRSWPTWRSRAQGTPAIRSSRCSGPKQTQAAPAASYSPSGTPGIPAKRESTPHTPVVDSAPSIQYGFPTAARITDHH